MNSFAGLEIADYIYFGISLEGFFYGLYTGLFAMYLYHGSKNGINSKIIFYALWALYISSLASIVMDMANFVMAASGSYNERSYHIYIISVTANGCGDFISQSILVYRCWIVWGRDIRVVIVPSILTFTFLATWLASKGSLIIVQGQISGPLWGYTVNVASLAMSMTVNALVTGLIVLRIFKVFRKVKVASDDQSLGTASSCGGRKLRSIIFILIESGMALFSIQLVRLVVSIVSTDAAYKTYELIVAIHQQINGITPTIILVQVSMGLSFHDEKSMEEEVESLCFASDPVNSYSDSTGRIGTVHQGTDDSDEIGVEHSDIELVDR